MQQHTGQHILSQAFLRTAQVPTISLHLGEETSTINIDLAQPSTSLMSETEALASRIVFEDRPVRVLNVDRSELAGGTGLHHRMRLILKWIALFLSHSDPLVADI